LICDAVLAVPLSLGLGSEANTGNVSDLSASFTAENVASIVADIAVLVPFFGVAALVLVIASAFFLGSSALGCS
jgi:hypothetical protein